MWGPVLNKAWRPLLLVVAALAFFVGAYFFFYRGDYDPPPQVQVPFEEISVPSSLLSPASAELPTEEDGLLVVDAAHRNNFTQGEVSVLLSRVAERGYDIKLAGQASPFGGFQSMLPFERFPLLDELLRQADAFVVILPQDPYLPQEVVLVRDFVGKGGKLLLIADPTRRHEINTLAESFGVAFQPDYLYDTAAYDINFRNIYVSDFRDDEVTEGLRRVALYAAGSIKSSAQGLAHTDGTTRSSLVERVEPFYPIVKVSEGRVLAISDLTFLIPPQNSILDNDRLISNVAGYLTRSQRDFQLEDFPHFLDGEVDILLGEAALFEIGTQLKSTLEVFQVDSQIRGVENLGQDTVLLGLYQDSALATQYLDLAGIHIGETLRTPFTPDIPAAGTALILLHKSPERRVLVVLGSSLGSLFDMVGRLGSGQFRQGLVSDILGVYVSF